jgi:hypothetical protein
MTEERVLLPQDPVPMVRIQIPAKAAFELDSLQTVLGNLAERLGHPMCLSGRNYFLELERDFIVTPELDVIGRFEGRPR